MKVGSSSTQDSLNSFIAGRRGSKDLFERAQAVLPAGVSHNMRWTPPFPIYIERAEGAQFWDVDGNDYIDYGMASGSLFLGHSNRVVVDAIRGQLERSTGATSCTRSEVEWAELVQTLIPSAERVRFTASGTEATLLATRLARAYRQKPKLVKFEGHYHGWHDYNMVGHREPFDKPASAGVPVSALGEVLVASVDDPLGSLTNLLERDDIAAVILEPTGASWGTAPVPDGFLQAVRDATSRSGVVLIFDEIISGFRVSPGGSQLRHHVIPDLTTLGKIMTGGLPGGGVVGRADIMELLSAQDPGRAGYVLHYGTFNGNPLTAVAGAATLRQLLDGAPHKRADEHGTALRSAIAALIDKLGVNGFVYGDSSIFHICLSTRNEPRATPATLRPHEYLLMPNELIQRLHWELRLHGVNLMTYNGGMASAVHGGRELDRAVEAFEFTLRTLRDEKIVGTSA